MRLSFRQLHLNDACAFWNSVAPPDWHLDVSTLISCSVGCPTFDWGASGAWVEGDEIVALAWAKRGLNDVAHLSAIAFRDPIVGADLLTDIKELLRNRGQVGLQFGRDSRHVFPGVPDNWPALRDFLTVEGFEVSSIDPCVDLVIPRLGPRADVADARPCEPHDVEALLAFLDREFPGRWAADVRDKLAHEAHPAFLWRLGDPVRGFAVTQHANDRLHLAGAVAPRLLTAPWMAVGPIGLAAEARGQGEGSRFLGRILAHARERGIQSVRVDWTHLADWYGRFGFEIERSYTPVRLDLGS